MFQNQNWIFIIYKKYIEKQQIFTSQKLQSVNVWLWTIDDENRVEKQNI